MKHLDLIGQDGKLEQLMRSVQTGRIVHALLFSGPAGTGKRTAARWFAQAMLCQDDDPPCGSCPACRRFLAGSHPDVRILKPERNAIRVDAIRDLIEYLSVRPYEGGMHIVIIEQADKMNANAQNALLKTLENPPEDAMFFLLTESAESMLSTILSRCQMVRFAPLTTDQCADVLKQKGIDADRAAQLAGFAQGSVGRALEIDADENYLSLRGKVIESLNALRGDASVAKAASLLADEDSTAALEIMELWARDLMVSQNGQKPYEASDESRLRAFKVSGSRLLNSVMDARRKLSSNVSWINVLESMYFELSS